MKIDPSLPVHYGQNTFPAAGEGYGSRSVDQGNSGDAKNVLVPVPPHTVDDVVDINGWSSGRNDRIEEAKSAEGRRPDLVNPADSEALQTRPADERSRAMEVYAVQQYQNQAGQVTASLPADSGNVDYPKGSMVDVWA